MSKLIKLPNSKRWPLFGLLVNACDYVLLSKVLCERSWEASIWPMKRVKNLQVNDPCNIFNNIQIDFIIRYLSVVSVHFGWFVIQLCFSFRVSNWYVCVSCQLKWSIKHLSNARSPFACGLIQHSAKKGCFIPPCPCELDWLLEVRFHFEMKIDCAIGFELWFAGCWIPVE